MIARGFLPLALLAASATAIAAADGNTGEIYGRVLLSTTKQPICPVSVRVLSNRESQWRTQTGKDGSFVFLQVRPGPVTVVVGNNRERRQINVSANLPNKEYFYLDPLHSSRHVMVTQQVAQMCPGSSYHGYAGE